MFVVYIYTINRCVIQHISFVFPVYMQYFRSIFQLEGMPKKYTTVIFDLDGTLMDTLADLAASTNYALSEMGFPTRSVDEVRAFVGNGVRKLVERAVPAGVGASCVDEVLALFRTHYTLHCKDHSAPYEGIADTLARLRNAGFQMAIVSNKPDSEVKQLNREFFAGLIEVAVGENEKAGIPKKPSPEMLEGAMRLLGAEKDKCLYVGDSDVDILTATNAGVDCLSVTWGFRSADFLVAHGAVHLVDRPSQLLDFLN